MGVVYCAGDCGVEVPQLTGVPGSVLEFTQRYVIGAYASLSLDFVESAALYLIPVLLIINCAACM